MDNILDKLNRNILDMEVVCEKFSADVEDYANVENHDEILEQVFDDSYIKAQKSPFQIYPDDRRKDLPENIIPDFKRVVQEYRSGVIDIRMMNILEIIINHRYITTRQIWQLYLLLFKKYIKYQHLNKLLKRMSEQGLIAIYETESAIGNAKYHFYCVDYNGARLYSSQHKQSSWQKTDVILPIEIMKKSLAKNQFLIACLKHYDFQYELQPRLKWCENNQAKTIVPTIQMTFNKENKDGNIVLMVEVLRNSQRWKEEYQEKLVRYGQYLKSKEDTQELNRYYLIVCAESNEQILSAINDGGSVGQADAVFLVSLDFEHSNIRILAIPRDTMVSIVACDENGNEMGAFTGQLALQYAYADGQEKSCSLVIGQVADILKNEVPINGYVAMNLSCIGTVNDAVGGVTVEMDDDYTLYNAKFKKGATVHLQGEEAQEFVQGRDITVSGSAYSRIGRQKRYLKAFISQAKKTLAQNPALAVNLMSQLSDYMLTDISTDEVLYLSTELSGCNFDEENMQILQGNIQMGEQYEEYYLDDEAVQQTIIDLFYEEQKK